MARPANRSPPEPITITLPAQTHAYLVKLATAGALAQTEQGIAALIVVNEVERLIAQKRAETVLAQPDQQPDRSREDES
jgi:hypothetical protein